MSRAEIHIGVVVASSPASPAQGLEVLARRLADDVAPPLESASGVRWVFHPEEPTDLPTDEPRRPSDFLGPG